MQTHNDDHMPLLPGGQPETDSDPRNADFYPAGAEAEETTPKKTARAKAASPQPNPPPPMTPPAASPEPESDFAPVAMQAATASADDEFSPENLALSQNFAGMTQTRRLLTTVRVGKPRKEAWVRTSQNPEHWVVGSVLELSDQGDETYWVSPKVRDALFGEPCLKAVRLILSVDRQGVPFLWKIGMPDPNGRSQPWVDSMMDAANCAKSSWVRVAWSSSTRAYESTVAEITTEPKWPSESLTDLLKIAFRGRVVSNLDHPVIRTLRGQD